MLLKVLFVLTGVSGALAVALGAFGAHSLRGRLDEKLLSAFETGVNYQLIHTLALLAICTLAIVTGPRPLLMSSGYAFLTGILLFSGSLYGLALTGLKWLGPVTPLGGLCFIVGWVLLAVWAGGLAGE